MLALWPFLKALFTLLPAIWQAARDRRIRGSSQRAIIAAILMQLNDRVTEARDARDAEEAPDKYDRADK